MPQSAVTKLIEFADRQAVSANDTVVIKMACIALLLYPDFGLAQIEFRGHRAQTVYTFHIFALGLVLINNEQDLPKC